MSFSQFWNDYHLKKRNKQKSKRKKICKDCRLQLLVEDMENKKKVKENLNKTNYHNL